MNNFSEILKSHRENIKEILKCTIGIERESLRIDNHNISKTKHPLKKDNPFITTDFAEAQVEFISDVYDDEIEIENQLSNLYNIFLSETENEYLWPYSIPPKVNESDIQESVYKDTVKTNYRKYLSNKYGKKKQLICGIHFNLSFSDKFIDDAFKFSKENDFKNFKNKIYLHIIKNYEKTKLLTILFFGATPFDDNLKTNALSLRNGESGYKNYEDLNIDYSSIYSYKKSVQNLIDKNIILDAREIYEAARPKNQQINVLETIEDTGIKYIEIRNIDINPYIKTGISANDLIFLKYIIIYSFLMDSKFKPLNRQLENKLADNGDIDSILYDNKSTREIANEMLDDMTNIFSELGLPTKEIEKQKNDLNNNKLTFQRLTKDISHKGFYEFLSNKGMEYKKSSQNNIFNLKNFESMELSTIILIKEAIKKGLHIDVLDKKDCFIKIYNDKKEEYIVQATKTSKDRYVDILKMENKVVSKKLLIKNNINTPIGADFTDREKALTYGKTLKRPVVKPKSTNFGLGISIFMNNPEDIALNEAIDHAFKYDSHIILEEYIDGEEYRFLVINNRCVGVLQRVPANVQGNGELSIKELIDIKNQDPLRGEKYNKPLEKIKIDLPMIEYLKVNNKTIDYIPKHNEIVYLRKNSNISTGGDSIDFTDICHPLYKEIAIEATKAMDAFICGVDIIIEDIEKLSNYSVLEVNFNPAIHIHSYPYKGKNRNIGKIILEELGF